MGVVSCGTTMLDQGVFENIGAVTWDTTVKTSGFTASSGNGYFCNTTGGAFTVTLPSSPSAGAIVAVKDYAKTWDTNNLTLGRNSSKIGGADSDSVLTTEGLAVTLVFIDATQGWLVTDSGLQSEAPGAQFLVATGGTITTVCTNYKVHTFTGPGTFCVSEAGNAAGSNAVDYMVVAGGGGSGTAGAGGGGAGGYRESTGCGYTSSPLGSGVPSLPVSVQGYPITVGGGGAGLPRPTPIPGAGGARGSNSIFSSITSTGGGGSPSQTESITSTGPGGSGGGVAKGGGGAGGTGNTPPVSPSQGNNGGVSGPGVGGAGGGAGGVGTAGDTATGGAGTTSSINGTPTTRAGGGGGGSDNSSIPGGPAHPGGGGGGQGGNRPDSNSTNGTANTGGGSGAQGEAAPPGTQRNGGSGIVIIRYKFQ